MVCLLPVDVELNFMIAFKDIIATEWHNGPQYCLQLMPNYTVLVNSEKIINFDASFR